MNNQQQEPIKEEQASCHQCARKSSLRLITGEFWCSWCGQPFNPQKREVNITLLAADTEEVLKLLGIEKNILSDKDRNLAEAVNSVAKIAKGDSYPQEIDEQFEIIERLADLGIAPVISVFLNDGKCRTDVQYRIARLARNLNAVQVLIKSAPFSTAAIIELGNTGDERAMRTLLNLASEKSIVAIRALGGFKDSDLARDTLLRYLEHVDDNVMAAAMEALGDLALPVLERINRRKIAEHRWSYADILWKVANPKNPEAVEILLEAFKVWWLQKPDRNGDRKYGTSYPGQTPPWIAGALRVLKERGAVKTDDTSTVDEVLALFPCNSECDVTEYATAWQLPLSPIPYNNNCVSPTDKDSRNRRTESLTSIIAHPDKRLTAALLHSLHQYIYNGLIFNGTDDYEFVIKDQTILKYQAALEALNDEDECIVWLTQKQAHLHNRLDLFGCVITRALGNIGTAKSIVPLSITADNIRLSVSDDQKEAMAALAEICRKLAPTLDKSVLDSVRCLLEAAAQDSRNFVRLPAKRALTRMSSD